jgi:hypothetical protein
MLGGVGAGDCDQLRGWDRGEGSYRVGREQGYGDAEDVEAAGDPQAAAGGAGVVSVHRRQDVRVESGCVDGEALPFDLPGSSSGSAGAAQALSSPNSREPPRTNSLSGGPPRHEMPVVSDVRGHHRSPGAHRSAVRSCSAPPLHFRELKPAVDPSGMTRGAAQGHLASSTAPTQPPPTPRATLPPNTNGGDRDRAAPAALGRGAAPNDAGPDSYLRARGRGPLPAAHAPGPAPRSAWHWRPSACSASALPLIIRHNVPVDVRTPPRAFVSASSRPLPQASATPHRRGRRANRERPGARRSPSRSACRAAPRSRRPRRRRRAAGCAPSR